MTLEQALLCAVSTLAGVVAMLWRMQVQAALKCEQDRDNLWRALLSLHKNSCGAHGCDERETVELNALLPANLKPEAAK